MLEACAQDPSEFDRFFFFFSHVYFSVQLFFHIPLVDIQRKRENPEEGTVINCSKLG